MSGRASAWRLAWRGGLVIAVAVTVAVALQRISSAQPGHGPVVLSRAVAVERDVQRLRGLAPLRQTCRRLVGQAELVALVRARVRSQYNRDELGREGQLLGLLGIIDRPNTYERRLFDMLGDTIAGYYDPDGDCLYLNHAMSAEELEETLYHETTHALQDQHFDLGRFMSHQRGHSDRQLAASAVAEGDAAAVTYAATSPDGVAGLSTPGWAAELRRLILEPAPRGRDRALQSYLRTSLSFSYASGLELVQATLRHGGWPAVNRLYSTPPPSTEAVLHPERSGAAMRPRQVTLSAPSRELPESCRTVHQDTLGELTLRQALARHMSEAEAAAAVDGWGGDRVLLLDDCPGTGRQALVAATLWDRGPESATAHADAFATAFTAAAGRRHGTTAVALESDAIGSGASFESGRGACTAVSRRGRAVVFVENVPCAVLPALLAQLHRQASRPSRTH